MLSLIVKTYSCVTTAMVMDESTLEFLKIYIRTSENDHLTIREFAWQACLAVVLGRRAWQSCLAVVLGSRAWQSCLAVVLGSRAWQSCLAVMLGSHAWNYINK